MSVTSRSRQERPYRRSPNGNRRGRTISLTLDESEWEMMLSRLPSGMSKAEFARYCLLNNSAPAEVSGNGEVELSRQLARLGNNLNQLARTGNQIAMGAVVDPGIVRGLLLQVKELVERIEVDR